jgi:Ser/Thr protein kinase RdoA (MazF antagonist)
MRAAAECGTPSRADVSRLPPNGEVVRSAARAFGLDAGSLSFVRDVANVVFVSGSEPKTRFLRLTHRLDRPLRDVQAELAWLRFLVDEDLPVCRPLPSNEGALVVQTGPDYAAACFTRVRGEPIEREAFTEPVFEQMGRFLGRLHEVSSRFAPAPADPVRRHWYELDSKELVLGSWDPSDELVATRFVETFDRLRAAPVADGRYGLIHGDVHRGNIFAHPGGIDVFDFDDCCRAPLVMDIAHALYYSLWFQRDRPLAERSAFAQRFLAGLLRGYRSECPFDDAELAPIMDMLDYRELAVDAFSHRRRRLPGEDLESRWALVRARFARGEPYVELHST